MEVMVPEQAADDVPENVDRDGSFNSDRVDAGPEVTPIADIGDLLNMENEDHWRIPRRVRRAYSIEEDEAIIRAIVINDWYKKLGGNVIYKKMQESRVVRRSWQSIKNRVKHYILENLDFYEMPRHALRRFRRIYNGRQVH